MGFHFPAEAQRIIFHRETSLYCHPSFDLFSVGRFIVIPCEPSSLCAFAKKKGALYLHFLNLFWFSVFVQGRHSRLGQQWPQSGFPFLPLQPKKDKIVHHVVFLK